MTIPTPPENLIRFTAEFKSKIFKVFASGNSNNSRVRREVYPLKVLFLLCKFEKFEGKSAEFTRKFRLRFFISVAVNS